MLETACNKSTVFGADSVMVLAGIHHGGRTAVVDVGGALTVIETRPRSSTLFLSWMSTVDCFNMTMSDRMLHVLGVSAAPKHSDITLAGPFAGFKPNRTSMGCTATACELEEFTTQGRIYLVSGGFPEILCRTCIQ